MDCVKSVRISLKFLLQVFLIIHFARIYCTVKPRFEALKMIKQQETKKSYAICISGLITFTFNQVPRIRITYVTQFKYNV